MSDGTGVCIRGIDWELEGVRSLVDAFGGRIEHTGPLIRSEPKPLGDPRPIS